MNEVYTEREINGILDHLNVVSKENEQLRQLLVKALRVLSSPPNAKILTEFEKAVVVEMEGFLQPVG